MPIKNLRAENPCFNTSRRTYSGIEASSKENTGLGIPLPIIVISFDLRQSSETDAWRLDTAGCSM
jgi:hypothetical protein